MIPVERRWEIEESVFIRAAPERVYAAVADVRSMGRWSPECVAVRGVPHGPVPVGARFIGFNRKGPFVWFTGCRVTSAEPGAVFAFRVSTFGLPVALWGYRFAPEEDGTRVTEYWRDLRTGRRGGFTGLLGRVFTGTRPDRRHLANLVGMRATLGRLKQALES
ncbi:SRPBCC family protein [Streptomyces somaliensis]|uniref:SRPBCC family protein n=1 Tax=Streptomyces somaliensis TaxID=78355 RepID=UPI0020CC51A2|nr:SRPBCC family protein [Streptomyces somaliensis]MCP9944753.1 SRPBCC family protein [Streptomyces somaliensis]MCP9962020.1 SRPBCC family protein [Streptomyces somaliensis]MCP9974840.1 SRPBCC family protein [Streptomyces somaliensis]